MRIAGECASLDEAIDEGGLNCSLDERALGLLVQHAPGLPIYLNNDHDKFIGTIINATRKGSRVVVEADIVDTGAIQNCWLIPVGLVTITSSKMTIVGYRAFGLCTDHPPKNKFLQPAQRINQ